MCRVYRPVSESAWFVNTARAARDLAIREKVEMPISNEIFSILYENKPAKQVVIDLMRRGLKDERN